MTNEKRSFLRMKRKLQASNVCLANAACRETLSVREVTRNNVDNVMEIRKNIWFANVSANSGNVIKAQCIQKLLPQCRSQVDL